MLFKIEDESYDGNEAVEKSKGNVSKAEDTIEAAQKEINVRPSQTNATLVAFQIPDKETQFEIHFEYAQTNDNNVVSLDRLKLNWRNDDIKRR